MARIQAAVAATLFLSLVHSTSLAQTTIQCERVDTNLQRLGNLTVTTAGNSSFAPFAALTQTNLFWPQVDERAVAWTASNSANANGNGGLASFDITAQNPTGWGEFTMAPQVNMTFGGTIDASAVSTDPGSSGGAFWGINPQGGFFNIPAEVQGSFEVLGDAQTGVLYGTIDIIITLNPSGNWNLTPTEGNEDAAWEITCGSSMLRAWRTNQNDGWDVLGILHFDGTPTFYDQVWPDNVNQMIFVSEEVSTGDTRGLEITIPRLLNTSGAFDTGPTNSTVLSGFSFSSSFEVEAD